MRCGACTRISHEAPPEPGWCPAGQIMARKATIVEQRRLFDGFFKIDEVEVSCEHADGSGARQKREVFERGDAVAVLLLDRDSRCLVLVEQFRVPVLVARRRDDPAATDGWLLETIAGMIDPADASPQAAAVRETLEETGYRIDNPHLIGSFLCSPGGSSERVFLYFAEVSHSD